MTPRTNPCMIAVFAVFWLAQGNGSPADLVILVAVLIVHELGHADGMRTFYRAA